MGNNEYPPYQEGSTPYAPYQAPPRPAEPPPNYGAYPGAYPGATGYAGYDAAQYGQYGPGYPTSRGVSGLAIASLVCSLLGLSLVGVILGHLGLSEIKRSNGLMEGRGLALAGLIVGYVEIAIGVAIILFIIIGALVFRAAPTQ